MSTIYGFNPSMNILQALRVMFWIMVKKETFRGIAYDYWPHDKNNQKDEGLRGNQLYGMDVAETARRKIGL